MQHSILLRVLDRHDAGVQRAFTPQMINSYLILSFGLTREAFNTPRCRKKKFQFIASSSEFLLNTNSAMTNRIRQHYPRRKQIGTEVTRESSCINTLTPKSIKSPIEQVRVHCKHQRTSKTANWGSIALSCAAEPSASFLAAASSSAEGTSDLYSLQPHAFVMPFPGKQATSLSNPQDWQIGAQSLSVHSTDESRSNKCHPFSV